MHPDDASERGLNAEDMVCAWNDYGKVQLRLVVTDKVRPGVVCSPKGAWLKTSETNQTTNALVPGHRTDIGDGACYNDARIEVGRY